MLIVKYIITSILTFIAKLIIRKYRPGIIAVTGSVGKTSTKDAIFSALAKTLYVRKSEKSFNSEIGVPLSIIGAPNGWRNPLRWFLIILKGIELILFRHSYPHYVVLEIGADRPGDIEKISRWLFPDVTVITRFSKVPVHVEFFGTSERLLREKSYLIEALKDNGTLVLNNDDPDVEGLRRLHRGKVLTFGLGATADARGGYYDTITSTVDDLPMAGFSFKVDYKGSTIPIIRQGILGTLHMYPVLAAIIVADVLGVNLVSAAEGIGKENPPPGRMRLLQGIKQTIIIDDTYNASPVATEEALRTLASIRKKSGRRIAVLGDMLELGKFSAEAHKAIGADVAKSSNIFIAVGYRMHQAAEAALEAGLRDDAVFQYESAAEAGKFLQNFIADGDVVLVKGSQGMRMERVVEEIMAEPEKKEALLVRQDKEWQEKK